MKYLIIFFIPLNCLAQLGTLILNSSPSSSDVYIDGKFKGTTPLDVMVSVGNHNIEVKQKEGVFLWKGSEIINLKNQEIKRVTVSLSKEIVPPNGVSLKKTDKAVKSFSYFYDGLVIIKSYSGSGCGYMDIHGSTAIDTKYKKCGNFNNGLALVTTFDNSVQYINKNDQVVLGTWKLSDNEELFDFSDGIAIKENRNNNNWMYTTFDQSGKQIGESIETPYYKLRDYGFSSLGSSFHEGMTSYTLSKSGSQSVCGYKDISLSTVISAKFETCGNFSDGLALVRNSLGGKFGYIDKSGNIAIPYQFDNANEFSEGLALVKQNDEYFFINKNSSKTFSTDFKIGNYGGNTFKNGFAVVSNANNKYFIINKNGRTVLSLGEHINQTNYSIVSFDGGYTFYIANVQPK